MKRIRRVLIANRGEIALRIIRTCHRLGIETVLAASEADLDSMPARLADKTICIGPAHSTQSYLQVDKVMDAARQAQVDALHPGYGFLSENHKLAEACDANGIIFIGPTVEQLDAVGDKLKARSNAIAAGLPVVPGGEVNSLEDAQTLARDMGYPLLIKAVSGGGGRGMKRVYNDTELKTNLELATAEAEAAFGDARIYIERLVTSGRHVEVQILGDGEQVIHLGTRDCSVQRRYQKLVEEAPAPHLSDSLRESMHEAAVTFAKHLQYRGLGTVELLVDCGRETFYFLEMNARIQVEHPVTEAITGLDLVEEQIAVAEGLPLRLQQDDVQFHGHAIECRINAEDWQHDFQPSPGTIAQAVFPAGQGIRIDTHVQGNSHIPPYYDSLLAKLIVHGHDRDDAIQKLQNALGHCHIAGINTNVGMHSALLTDDGFIKGGMDTAYFPQFIARATQGTAHG